MQRKTYQSNQDDIYNHVRALKIIHAVVEISVLEVQSMNPSDTLAHCHSVSQSTH